MDRSTLAIHAGRGPRVVGAPLSPPLVLASSFHGAMLSFEVADPAAVCARVQVFTHAKSLGGVESLIDRRGPSLLRLSVGCEHVEDLWRDLDLGLVGAEDLA